MEHPDKNNLNTQQDPNPKQEPGTQQGLSTMQDLSTQQDQRVRWRRIRASLCMGGFLVLLALVVTHHTVYFDDAVRNFFYDLRSEPLTKAVILLTNAANKYFIIALCLLLLAVPRTRLYFGVPLSSGELGTILLNSGIKHLVCRTRPELILHLVEENGYSFPSGHSCTSMFFYGMALWLIWHYYLRRRDFSGEGLPAWRQLPSYSRKTAVLLTVLLLIPMITVGITRVYLGVHFPTDVLGGWCLGGFCIFVEAELIEMLERRSAGRAG